MTAQPSENNLPAMGEASRVANVFFDPKKAFADIAARPRWVVPIVLMIVASVIFIYAFSTHVGWEGFMRKTMETNSRMQQMDAQQRENVIQGQIKIAPIFGYGGSVLGIPIYALAIAGALLVMCKMMDANLNFRQLFAMTSYAMLPGLVFTLLAIIVMFLKPVEDFNLQNPLFFNVGAFMEPPPNSGKFIYSLASSIDLFTFWTMALLATGISVAARRFTFGKAFMTVATPWVLWVLVKSAWAGIMG